MARREIDDLDGYNGRVDFYDEKADKRYQSMVWIGMIVCSTLIILWGVYHQINEYMLKVSGYAVEGTYDEINHRAVVANTDGQKFYVDISSLDPVHNGDQITLYYRYNVAGAKPMTTFMSWMKIYAGFLVVIGFCSWRVTKIYSKKRKHYVEESSGQ